MNYIFFLDLGYRGSHKVLLRLVCSRYDTQTSDAHLSSDSI